MPAMTNVDDLVEELVRRWKWQVTPTSMEFDDYFYMIKYGIRRMYIDTMREELYQPEGYVLIDTPTADDPTMQTWFYPAIFENDETEYIILAAEVNFLQALQGNVNAIVGYTTDALSVTNADKPYQYLSTSLAEREEKLKNLFYKMSRFGTVV